MDPDPHLPHPPLRDFPQPRGRPRGRARTRRSRSACPPGSVRPRRSPRSTAADASSSGDVATSTDVAAPCSGLRPHALRLRLASSARSSVGMCRCRLVRIPPGIRALTVMPSPPSAGRLDREQHVGGLRLAVGAPAARTSRARSGCRRRRTGERRWPLELTETTARPPAAASAACRPVASAKWPRWLVANCSSQPSRCAARAGAITPALLTRTCSGPPPAGGERAHRGLVGEVDVGHPHVGVAGGGG